MSQYITDRIVLLFFLFPLQAVRDEELNMASNYFSNDKFGLRQNKAKWSMHRVKKLCYANCECQVGNIYINTKVSCS